jgi:hypothetical protein
MGHCELGCAVGSQNAMESVAAYSLTPPPPLPRRADSMAKFEADAKRSGRLPPPAAKLLQCQQTLISDPHDDGPRSLEPRLE